MSHQVEHTLQTATLHWSPMTRNLILPEAEKRFSNRLQMGKGLCSSDDAHFLTEEVLSKTLQFFCPTVGQVDLRVEALTPDKVLAGGSFFSQGPWSSGLRKGDSLRLYCLSAGAAGHRLWQACGEDPVLAAATHLLGNEIVYALGRSFDRMVRNDNQEGKWFKLALLSTGRQKNTRCEWDPVVGRDFFKAFAGADAPVSISQAGSFDPTHTVLGLFWRSSIDR